MVSVDERHNFSNIKKYPNNYLLKIAIHNDNVRFKGMEYFSHTVVFDSFFIVVVLLLILLQTTYPKVIFIVMDTQYSNTFSID